MKHLIFAFLLLCIPSLSTFAQNSNCPTLEVTSDGVVSAGQTMYFTANVENTSSARNIEYEWRVSAGKIVSGQGSSPVIAIETTALDGQNITATVKIKGLPSDCLNEISETGSVLPVIGCGMPADQFADISSNDEKARLDSFLIHFSNNPNNEGFIVLRRGQDETDEQVRKRLQRMLKHFKFRKFPKERFIFGFPRKEESFTTLWLVPPGAELPACNDCDIIYGKDLDN